MNVYTPTQLQQAVVGKVRRRWWEYAMQRGLMRQLPRAMEVIAYKPRFLWVFDAMVALIQTMPPGFRYVVLREGFPLFQDRAGAMFRELAPCTFDSTELRHIFEGLESWAKSFEAHLQPGLDLLYERQRRLSGDVPIVDEDVKPAEADVTIESVKDGSLRRRDVLGGDRWVH